MGGLAKSTDQEARVAGSTGPRAHGAALPHAVSQEGTQCSSRGPRRCGFWSLRALAM